jgi:HD-GYP domain-containing protein (c-di-GMP phosphodiesterase class II)
MALTDAEVESLRLGALLHDVGKIGVSDAVLRKPGKLTQDEFEQIKLHPTLGARILKPLRFLDAQLAVVELHHERPDGRGYPHGLKGDDIPLFARIVHVADAFDAMTSARAYRSALPVAAAMAELWRLIGVDFDGPVVQAMARLPIAVSDAAARTPEEAATAAVTAPGAVLAFPLRPAVGGGIPAHVASRRTE